jgi:hypothetical protein
VRRRDAEHARHFCGAAKLAPGTASTDDQSGSRMRSPPNQTSPRMLSITAGASSVVSPSGWPASTRACSSNWLLTQASIV